MLLGEKPILLGENPILLEEFSSWNQQKNSVKNLFFRATNATDILFDLWYYDNVKKWVKKSQLINIALVGFFYAGKEEVSMPYKPKKPCAYPGCPNLTDKRYCPEHESLENKRYNKYQRDPEHKKRYGKTWQKIRARYVKQHPFCEMCLQKGKIVPVEQVHHKIPLAEGGTHDTDNLISLCQSCHSRIHAERGDRWHNKTPRGG